MESVLQYWSWFARVLENLSWNLRRSDFSLRSRSNREFFAKICRRVGFRGRNQVKKRENLISSPSSSIFDDFCQKLGKNAKMRLDHGKVGCWILPIFEVAKMLCSLLWRSSQRFGSRKKGQKITSYPAKWVRENFPTLLFFHFLIVLSKQKQKNAKKDKS